MSPIWPTPRYLAALMVCLLAFGLWQVGEGSWIYAKARLAQLLLQRAWSRTLTGEIDAKPWPWADTWPITRLIVPSQNIDQIVLEGAYGRTLAFGPGHLEASARPGQEGATVLTGHRDTHFQFLKRLRRGDVIALQSRSGQWIRFSVRERQIVDSRVASIHTDIGDTRLVLVTCYPFDAITPGGPLRFVVTAEAGRS
jgi:sortase A